MCTELKGSATKFCKFISRVKLLKAYTFGTPARLRAIMPTSSDILAVRIVIHHVRSQNLMAVAARVCMGCDTETGNCGRICHKTAPRNSFGICVTPILIRQNSSERLSAGLVLASATFSGPGTLLIRTLLAAVSACNQKKSQVQMTESLQTSPACHSNGSSTV